MLQTNFADEGHPPSDVLDPFVHNSQNESSALDMLNEDCLHHLFKYLYPLEIAYVSEANPRIFEFASNYIYPKHTNLNLFAHKGPDRTVQGEFAALKCMLQHYGPYVTHCGLNASRLKKPSVAHIIEVLRNCPNLVQIRLQNFDLSSNDIQILRQENMPATELEWIGMALSGNYNIWNNWPWTGWPNLRGFTFDSYYDNKLILNTLQSLEKLSLVRCRVDHLIRVIETNGETLKSLSLMHLLYVEKDLINQISYLAPNLEHFKIDALVDPECRLHGLKHLKHLQVYSFRGHINLKSFEMLEDLDFAMTENLDIIQSIGHVKSLKRLSFRQPKDRRYNSHLVIENKYIFEAVSTLPHLKRLYLCRCEWSTEDTVKVLENNRSIVEIELFLCHKETKPSVRLLVDCLKQQPKRLPVLITQTFYDKFNVEMDDTDRQLLRNNRHSIQIRLKESKWYEREEN